MVGNTHSTASDSRLGLFSRSIALYRLLCLALLALLLGGSLAFAGPAPIDPQVRADLEQSGRAAVIATIAGSALGESTLSPIELPAGGARSAALRDAIRRIKTAVPGLQVRREFTLLPFLAATVEADTLDQLAQRPEVAAIFPDRPVHAVLNQSGPLVGQPQAEKAGFTGKGVGIAIIDTGIDYTHPALGGTVTRVFTDTFPGEPFWREIQAAAENGIVAGFPDGSYQPTMVVTRDLMAVFIAHALAKGDANVPPGPATPSFSDVDATNFAYKYIEYCHAQGVVDGFPDGTYGPLLAVDRGQMAVFIARAIAGGDANVPAPPDTPTFPDVTATNSWSWVYKYVEYLHAQGVVFGEPDGLYHPEADVTRDQMAAFITRGFHLNWDGRVIGGTNVLAAYNPQDPRDDNGHGTMVSGIAASSDMTYRGLAPGANLLAVKALNSSGAGLSTDTIAGIEWCLQNQSRFNIHVINLSEGDGVANTSRFPGDNASVDDPMAVAITNAVNAGIVVTAASGNDGFTTGINFPAAAQDAIAVGATKDGGPEADAQPVDGIAPYTDRGSLLDLYAPGSVITSTQLGGGFGSGEGTSFAAPHVAGAAAVLWQKGVQDARQIKALLMQTGVPILDPATNVTTPRLSLSAAVSASSLAAGAAFSPAGLPVASSVLAAVGTR